MSLIKDFKDSVVEKYPDFTISKVGSTSHTNVMRLSKDGTHYIAKSVWFDSEDSSNEERAQRAFETEVSVLKMLPDFWNIRYIDSFVSSTGMNRIIVTTELPSCPWKDLKPKNYDGVARSILRQIKWLHDHDIVHGDLELKNILLSCDQMSATIIDFEKSKQGAAATDEEKAMDKTRLLSAVKNNLPPFLTTISQILYGRRASIGGTRHKRSRQQKRKTQRRKYA
jgi:serine/threonine protein kinase